jgi:hypothetical protein
MTLRPVAVATTCSCRLGTGGSPRVKQGGGGTCSEGAAHALSTIHTEHTAAGHLEAKHTIVRRASHTQSEAFEAYAR